MWFPPWPQHHDTTRPCLPGASRHNLGVCLSDAVRQVRAGVVQEVDPADHPDDPAGPRLGLASGQGRGPLAGQDPGQFPAQGPVLGIEMGLPVLVFGGPGEEELAASVAGGLTRRTLVLAAGILIGGS